jgi:hypothetical protein
MKFIELKQNLNFRFMIMLVEHLTMIQTYLIG